MLCWHKVIQFVWQSMMVLNTNFKSRVHVTVLKIVHLKK